MSCLPAVLRARAPGFTHPTLTAFAAPPPASCVLTYVCRAGQSLRAALGQHPRLCAGGAGACGVNPECAFVPMAWRSDQSISRALLCAGACVSIVRSARSCDPRCLCCLRPLMLPEPCQTGSCPPPCFSLLQVLLASAKASTESVDKVRAGVPLGACVRGRMDPADRSVNPPPHTHLLPYLRNLVQYPLRATPTHPPLPHALLGLPQPQPSLPPRHDLTSLPLPQPGLV